MACYRVNIIILLQQSIREVCHDLIVQLIRFCPHKQKCAVCTSLCVLMGDTMTDIPMGVVRRGRVVRPPRAGESKGRKNGRQNRYL
jgi:hypothetical protein